MCRTIKFRGGGDYMPSTWLENNKAHLHIVNVERQKNYFSLILKTVGSLTPQKLSKVKLETE